jgi:hypothetical protein
LARKIVPLLPQVSLLLREMAPVGFLPLSTTSGCARLHAREITQPGIIT